MSSITRLNKYITFCEKNSLTGKMKPRPEAANKQSTGRGGAFEKVDWLMFCLS